MNPKLIDAARRASAALPLFPLPDVVFFPYTLLPLHVFEPRYRALVRDALAADGVFAVPRLKPGWKGDYEGRPPVYPIAGVGKIVRSQSLPDGRFNLLLIGLARVRVEHEPATDQPYRVATATVLDEPGPPGGAAALSRLDAQLRGFTGDLIRAHPPLAEEVGRVLESADEPVQLVYMLAHLALRDPEARQQFLDAADLEARAELVMSGLVALLAPGQPLEA